MIRAEDRAAQQATLGKLLSWGAWLYLAWLFQVGSSKIRGCQVLEEVKALELKSGCAFSHDFLKPLAPGTPPP